MWLRAGIVANIFSSFLKNCQCYLYYAEHSYVFFLAHFNAILTIYFISMLHNGNTLDNLRLFEFFIWYFSYSLGGFLIFFCWSNNSLDSCFHFFFFGRNHLTNATLFMLFFSLKNHNWFPLANDHQEKLMGLITRNEEIKNSRIHTYLTFIHLHSLINHIAIT